MNKFPLTTSYARYKCENNLLCTQTYKSPKYAVRVNILIFYCFMQHYETIPLKKFLHILWLDSAKNYRVITRNSSKVFFSAFSNMSFYELRHIGDNIKMF